MKTRIVQVQGTSGAGKSTLARALMGWYAKQPGGSVSPVWLEKRGQKSKIIGYECRAPKRLSTYLVGKYETPCGGCDQVGSSAETLRRVKLFAEMGHVVFEGLLLSGGQGSLGRAMLKFGDRFAYAFLDTPLETCLKRVQARRVKRAKKLGKAAEPLNPKNTTSKWHACVRYREKCLSLGYTEYGLLPHRDPLPGLLKLLRLK